MRDFPARLQSSGEYVDDQAPSPQGTFARYGGEGKPLPAVTSALVAGSP